MKDERTYIFATHPIMKKENRVFIIRKDRNVPLHAYEVRKALKQEKKRLKSEKKQEKLKLKREECKHIVCTEEECWRVTVRICIACGRII